MIFIFFVEGGRGWGWGSRGFNRWKCSGVGNAKDRVGGSTGCIMHRVHTSKDIRNQNRQLLKKSENCLTLERTSLKNWSGKCEGPGEGD
jgi:hypothetical protein